MSKKRDDERSRVGSFLQHLKLTCPWIYIQIDQDTPARVLRSGYDFMLACNDRAMFVEAKTYKRVFGKSEAYVGDAEKDGPRFDAALTDYQKLTRADLLASACTYVVFAVRQDCTGPALTCSPAGQWVEPDLYKYIQEFFA